MSYDIKNEVFSEVSVPDVIEERDVSESVVEDFLLVKVLGGYLCLVHVMPTYPVDIWVMKEYGIKSSWVKLYTIVEEGRLEPAPGVPHANSRDKVVGVNGAILYDRRVFCYDFNAGLYEVASEGIPTDVLKRELIGVFIEKRELILTEFQ